MKAMYKIKGVVQHYSWGGEEFIPSLLNISNDRHEPFAEYWLGAHPNASSKTNDNEQSLLHLINENKKHYLGERVSKSFGSLPYLFKILDVKQMLSIQVHPSKESAIEEFEKENEKGIPLTASHRNYKDQNHKPELMVALGDFWLLHGFKKEEELRAILKNVNAFQFLLPVFERAGYKGLYEEVMTMPQEKVNAVLTPLMEEIIPLYKSNSLKKTDEHFWAARAALSFCKNNNYDRGIFSIYLFNLLHLKEGEGIYQPAGLPHAYLEGQNVEVMANSDNVLRAGLTDKHIDLPELMKHVIFEATDPKIIKKDNDSFQSFDTPAEEFLLKKYEVKEKVSIAEDSATILFVCEGGVTIESDDKEILLNKGEAVFIAAGEKFALKSSSAIVFTTSVPAQKN